MVGQEKRKTPRLDCRVPIMCRRGSLFDQTQTMDISQGGVGLLSPKFIPLDTNLIVEIALTPEAEPVLAVGRVRWIQKSNYSDSYRVGMNFTDIAADSKRRLAGYFDRGF